jgi:hypothetical protein
MLHYIKAIIRVENYTVICKFNTDEICNLNLENAVKKYSTNPSNFMSKFYDENYFKNVQLDNYGILCWNNEIDFCPDVLYSLSTGEAIYFIDDLTDEYFHQIYNERNGAALNEVNLYLSK